MFDAVARLLTNAARRAGRAADGGILLALDDLQWAGSDALDLLGALVRSAAPTTPSGEHRPLRIVGAYRDTEVRPHDVLATALADWAHAGLVSHRALPTLTADERRQLLGALLAGVGTAAFAPAHGSLIAGLVARELRHAAYAMQRVTMNLGVGLGALVGSQVPTLVGICAWLLFVEGLLVGDVAGVGAVGRFAPGALGMAVSGQDPDALVAPAPGFVLLSVYAVAATAAGWLATARRDVV